MIITDFMLGSFSCVILSYINVGGVVADVFIAISKVASDIIVAVVVCVQCEVEKKKLLHGGEQLHLYRNSLSCTQLIPRYTHS